MQQLTVLHALSLSRQTQRLERDVEPWFVSELEAIHYSVCGTGDLQRQSTYVMRLEPFVAARELSLISAIL
jgi:hypothetical protein